MTRMDITPFIQTHSFQVAPYLPRTQGYAPFLVSTEFNGTEDISFEALEPNSEQPLRLHSLNEYRAGQWYLAEADRINTATGGALKPGKYQFVIRSPNKPSAHIAFQYEPHFIEAAKDIRFQIFDNELLIEWTAQKDADNFWIFLLPYDSNNFFNDLIPISEKQHRGTRLILNRNKIPIGNYKIIIRTNQMWRHSSIPGFQSEAWSLCDGSISNTSF